MLIPKFELGQKVYAVKARTNTRQEHVKCEVCNSTGFVELKGIDDIPFVCPECRGKMETVHYGQEYMIAYSEATIGKISTEEYENRYGYKSNVTYMLKETGVGSGTVWNENRLFATEEEALEFCDKYIPSNRWGDEAVLK